MKLQINVSDEFYAFTEKLVETYKSALPEDMKRFTPRSPNALVPLALVHMAKELKQDAPDTIMSEANEVLARKPGPKKKDDRQLALVDDKPGVWISLIKISVGNAVVECNGMKLDIRGCHLPSTAGPVALEKGWGAIPETQNNVTGLRFIPPGASPIPEPVKPPKPNVTEVGVFISEAQIQAGPIAITADGRTVPRNIVDGSDRLGADVIRFNHAKLDTSYDHSPEDVKQQMLRVKTDQSFRIANADAVEIGWTVRRETRRDKRGFRYIPPGTKLRFVLPEQEVEVE